MNELYLKPCSVSQWGEILDVNGGVVVPTMVWKGDYEHKVKQMKLAKLICDFLNSHETMVVIEKEGNNGHKKFSQIKK